MQLIAGLGNPGDEYRHHRHNIGFMAVDQIARQHNFPTYKSKFNGLISDGMIDGARVLLVKPQTFMNRSGECIGKVARFYKIPVEKIIVLYDELDLAPGKVRVKSGGGNGGHNGLRSIDPVVGVNYQRVRIGIGHPGHKELVTRHVLGNFAKADAEWLEPLLDAIAENAGLLTAGDGPNFMNHLALAQKGQAEPPTKKKKPQNQNPQPAAKTSEQSTSGGPMAGVLKKLFGKE
jgi:PTH1 family peptidyl-tRNA hydrolase